MNNQYVATVVRPEYKQRWIQIFEAILDALDFIEHLENGNQPLSRADYDLQLDLVFARFGSSDQERKAIDTYLELIFPSVSCHSAAETRMWLHRVINHLKSN